MSHDSFQPKEVRNGLGVILVVLMFTAKGRGGGGGGGEEKLSSVNRDLKNDQTMRSPIGNSLNRFAFQRPPVSWHIQEAVGRDLGDMIGKIQGKISAKPHINYASRWDYFALFVTVFIFSLLVHGLCQNFRILDQKYVISEQNFKILAMFTCI